MPLKYACIFVLKKSRLLKVNIIELAIYVLSRALDRQLLNGRCHHHQNRRLCSRPHSHESLIFSYFCDSYFFKLRRVWFVELIKTLLRCLTTVRVRQCGSAHYTKIGDTGFFDGTLVQPIQRRRRGLWTNLALLNHWRLIVELVSILLLWDVPG